MTEEIRVRLPRLLKREFTGTRLKEAGRFHPISMPIDLNILPLSTATMTLAENDLDVKVHDFAELYNQHGSVGIYRVASIEKVYRGRRRVELNHALDVLNDATYATQDNDEEEFDGTPTEYITKLLGAQTQKIGNTPFWQLGTCEDTETIQKKLRFQNVLEALCDLAKTHEGFYFTFDFTTFPWTLNFVARDNTIMSEFRLNRNISSCSVNVDDRDLCTHLYLSIDTKVRVASGDGEDAEVFGEKTEQTFATYDDAAAQAHWGVVDKTAGVEFPSAEVRDAKLQAWVNDYFARHHSPLVEISIDGQDWKEITGVSIDEVHLGRLSRIALPEYSEVFQERVVTIRYPDPLRKPTSVRVYLANKRQTTEDSIAAVKKEAARAGGAGGAAGKKAENNETEIERQKYLYNLKVERDDRHFAILATEEQWSEAEEAYLLTNETKFYQDARKFALIATEYEYAEAEDGHETLVSSLNSRITQTASQIRAEVWAAQSALYSYIELSSSQIRSEVGNSLSGVYSSIVQTASAIRADVWAANSDIYSYIEITASSIRTEVGNAESGLYSTIEQTASSIRADVWAANSDIYSYIELTASNIRTEVGSAESGLYSTIEQTASSIRADVWAANSDIYSYIELTASSIRTEVGSAVSGLYSSIEQTASSIRADVWAAESSLYSYILLTASNIKSEVGDSISGLYSSIEQTASSIRADVWAAESNLYSYIELTASSIRSEVGDAESGLYSSIQQTASEIRADVWAAESSFYSYVQITASSIKTEVGNSLSGVYSTIQQTDSSIRADVRAADSALYSYIQLTSSNIKSEVGNSLSGLYSSIDQSASSIRADVWAAESAMYSYVEITASRIRSEVASADSGLYSFIEQTSSSIAAVVTDVNTLMESGLWINRDNISLLIQSIGVDDVYVQDENGTFMRTWDATEGKYIYENAPSGYSGALYRLDQNANIGDAFEVKDEYIQDANGDYYRYYDSNLRQYVYGIAPSGYTGVRYRQERNVHVKESVGLKIDKVIGGSVASFGVYDANNLTAGYLISMINGQSTAKIQADKIILDGQTVANSLSADDVIVQELNVGSIFASGTISASNIVADTGHGQISVTSLADDLEDMETSMEDAVAGFGTPTASGGQISIPYTKVGGGTGTINFNIADTQFYQDGVSAAEAGVTLSGEWTGTTTVGKAYKVTASNGAARTSPKLNYIGKSGTPTWAENRKSFSQTLVVLDGDDDFLYQQAVSFDTTASYNAGKNSVSINSISISEVPTYSADSISYSVPIRVELSNDIAVTERKSFSAGAAYDAGKNSVVVSSATGWDDGENILTLSNGNTHTTYMPGSASWAGERNALGGFTVTCTVGGKEYYHVFSV